MLVSAAEFTWAENAEARAEQIDEKPLRAEGVEVAGGNRGKEAGQRCIARYQEEFTCVQPQQLADLGARGGLDQLPDGADQRDVLIFVIKDIRSHHKVETTTALCQGFQLPLAPPVELRHRRFPCIATKASKTRHGDAIMPGSDCPSPRPKYNKDIQGTPETEVRGPRLARSGEESSLVMN